MFDVIALGELLIDFTPNGQSKQGNQLLEANPGGAPCNVLAMLTKLGKKTAFIGKVGKDNFGTLLKNTIETIGIDANGLVFDEKIHTTLAFVHLNEHGDRNFSFCRNPGADMMLSEDELSVEMLKNTKIFHFGSLSMTSPIVRQATKTAISIAKENGSLLSFDPNLRIPLWDNLAQAKEQILYGISVCDILKISENELEFITGTADVDEAVRIVRENNPNIKVLFATLGKDGSSFYYKDMKGFKETFTKVKTIDTTGAGDTFCGCMLGALLDKDLAALTYDYLMDSITFANAASSLVTTKIGALKSMPNCDEVVALIHS